MAGSAEDEMETNCKTYLNGGADAVFHECPSADSGLCRRGYGSRRQKLA